MSRTPPIKGLLFDKDGTLLDYWRTWIPINRELALVAAGGDEALRDELLTIGGHDPVTDRVVPGATWAAAGLSGIIEMLKDHLGPRAPADLYDLGDELFREGGARYAVLLDGIRDAVEHLAQRGFRMGIATNDTAAGIEASLSRHDILHWFEFKAGCDSGYGAKPHPGMVTAFAAAIGASPAEVAVIGDSIHDIETARNASAGLAIAVLSGTSGREDLAPHADAVIDSVADVDGLLAVLSSRRRQPG